MGDGILYTIIIGGLAGLVAKFLIGGRGFSGFFITIALGIAGSVVAGVLGQALGLYRQNQSVGFLGSVVGAVVILGVYHMFTRSRTY